jgi:peptidoglycan/xylan/chitin deacetylase (PgdA/CDA1 family)
MGRLSERLCHTIRALRADDLVRATVARRRVSILMYHRPTAAGLERHLEYLLPRYTLIPLDALVDALASGEWDALPHPALVVTFDDAASEIAGLEHVLRRYDVPATVYACSAIAGTNRRFWFEAVPDPWSIIELPNPTRLALLAEAGYAPESAAPERSALSRDELERLCHVADVQSHTRFHPPLTTCTDAEAELEIRASREEIEALTGRPCLHLCYPHGIYGDREVAFARQAGYRSARTTDIGWNGPHADPFRLRILGTVDDCSMARLAADLSGIGFLFRLRELRVRRAPRWPRRPATVEADAA